MGLKNKIESYFKVMPEHTNWQPYNEKGNVIFGGVAMSQMDSLAAIVTTEVLRSSNTADYAVTYKCDFTFHRPVGSGDVIKFVAHLIDVEGKYEQDLAGRTISVKVIGIQQVTKNGEVFGELFSQGNFIFVSKKGSKYANHGLKNK